MLHLVCLNVNKTQEDLLDGVLEPLPHRLTFHMGFEVPLASPRPRTASTSATLRSFLKDRVPNWQGYEPIVLLARTSGVKTVQRWLTQEDDRELVTALVLVDPRSSDLDLTSFGDGRCGIIEYAKDCLADPSEKLLLSVARRPRNDDTRAGSIATLLQATLASSEGWLQPDRSIFAVDLDNASEADLWHRTVELLRRRLVPFLSELGPVSAPEPLL